MRTSFVPKSVTVLTGCYLVHAVPVLSGPAYMRATARRKMAPGLPGRLPLRTLPAFDGLPLPPHARRRQPPARALPSHLPNDRQGLHSYTYAVSTTLFFVRCLFVETGLNTNSVRSHVLAWRARKRYRYGTARGSRRGCRRHGQCDAPASSFLVLLAEAREPRSATRTATSPSRDRGVHLETGPLGLCFLSCFLLLRLSAVVTFRLSSVLQSS